MTVLARVNKNNKETYAKLTTGGAAAIALMITDEEPATVDSVEYTVGTNIKSAYTTVKSATRVGNVNVVDGFLPVEQLVKVYNNVTEKWVVSTDKKGDAKNEVKVEYTDLTTVHSPLSVYELRVDVDGQAMTIEAAAELFNYELKTKVGDKTVNYYHKANGADFAKTIAKGFV